MKSPDALPLVPQNFETVEQYEAFAQQCDVQASFAASPEERAYFRDQATTFRRLARLTAPNKPRTHPVRRRPSPRP
jgi:hypothetical protein